MSAADLILKLICEEENRLTADQIRNHEYFKDVNWTDVEARVAPAPFILQGVRNTASDKIDTAMSDLVANEASLLSNFTF